MKYSKALTVFAIILAAGGAVYLFINSGWYPVAVVNSRFITANVYEREFHAAYRYFYNVLSASSELTPQQVEGLKRDIRREALRELIYNRLVYEALDERIEGSLPEMVHKRIEESNASDPLLPDAVRNLYGLTMEEFRNLVLIPKAHQELLEGRLFAEDTSFETWLRSAVNDARVVVLTDGLEWNGEEVVEKSEIVKVKK